MKKPQIIATPKLNLAQLNVSKPSHCTNYYVITVEEIAVDIKPSTLKINLSLVVS